MVHEKKLVDEVSGWLKIYDDGSVDRTWTGVPEVEFLTKPVPAHDEFIDGVATRDMIIDPGSGLLVRIYIPVTKPDDVEKLPLLLHFQGGGFCITQAVWYMYYHFYTRLVQSVRAVCVSVQTRLAPEHRIPAACDDCYSALLWLRAVAQGESSEPWLKANADFERVFLIGDSTGGTLVHDIAARAGHHKELAPVRLAGGVTLHAGFMRAERSKSELEKSHESPMLTIDMVDKFMVLSLPIGSTKDHPLTCPMGAAAPPLSKLALPPFLVAVAEHDLMRDTQMEYFEAMKKAGQDVEVLITPGLGHCFYLNKIAIDLDPNTAAQTDRLIAAVTEFIKKH